MLLALTAASALVIPVALSWACGPQAQISPNKAVYAPGENGTISGQNFEPGASFAISIQGGPTLASGTVAAGQVTFSVAFTAPATAGTYTLRVDGQTASGNALPSAPTTITVSAPREAAPTPSAPADEPASAAQPAPADTSAGSPAATAAPPSQAARRPSRTPATAQTNRAKRPAARTPAARRPASRAPAAAQQSQPQTPAVFAGSVAKQTPVVRTPARKAKATAAARRSAPSANDGAPQAQPSESTAQASAWSGLGTGADAGLVPTGNFPAAGSSASNTTKTLSIVLLALGLTALAGGLGVSEARRRRAR